MSSTEKPAVKRFIFLENNPAVMTTLGHRLGLSKTLGFHDVYSLIDEGLLAAIPRPVYALLVVMPPTPTWTTYRKKEEDSLPVYDGSGADEPVYWIRQTIENACGLYGLIHIASNIPSNFIAPGSTFDKFFKETIPLKPTPRAQVLYDSEEFEQAHAAAAVMGDSTVPHIDQPDDFGHFIAFVKGKDGHLYEIEGARKGPVDRGLLAEDEDLLSPRALELGVKSLIKIENEGAKGDDLMFCCTALAPIDQIE